MRTAVLEQAFNCASPELGPYGQFIADANVALPRILIDRAIAVAPETSSKMNQIRLHLIDKAKVKNPELYSPLLALASGGTPNLREMIGKLELHLGLRNVEFARSLGDGVYRLVAPHGCVAVVKGSSLEQTISGWYRLNDSTLQTFVPINGLFSDLIPVRFYPSVAMISDCKQERNVIEEALRRIRLYSKSLRSAIEKTLSWIAITPNFMDKKRWSYSCRLDYLGGIFINPFGRTVDEIVEAIIHEYYHQALWQWWFFCWPRGMPAESCLVESPITRRRRSVPVMTQALMIYLEVLSYCRWSVAKFHESSVSTSVKRARDLEYKIPQLFRTLLDIAPPNTAYTKLVASLGSMPTANLTRRRNAFSDV